MNPTSTIPITVRINGVTHELLVAPTHTLLQVLRDQLGFTGTKECCGEGECGACTVLLDGRAVNSCLVLAVEADGAELLTVEGLAHDDQLDPLQQTFIDEGAIQCGYCTPGMLLSAKYLLSHTPNPTEEQVRQALSGNLCRCTGYERIIKAVLAAAAARPLDSTPHSREA